MLMASGAAPGADAAELLGRILRPAGGGIYTVSTGRAAQARLQERLYGAADEAEVERRWRGELARLREAQVLVLGVPSDVGAGFQRGWLTGRSC